MELESFTSVGAGGNADATGWGGVTEWLRTAGTLKGLEERAGVNRVFH